MNNALVWQTCDQCGAEYSEMDRAVDCVTCGGLLRVEQRAPQLRGVDLRTRLDVSHPSGVWQFTDLILPGVATEMIVSHPEGHTPLLRRERLERWADVDELWVKHEGHNPTGSFKDRGMTVGMTQAKRVSATAVACASTGNTSASLASYAAHAGIPAFVFVPEGQLAIGKLTQSLAYGARTLVVAGDFDDCLRLAREAASQLGVYLLNSINPYRVEGQKTIVFEMLQQFGWKTPDWIVLPAGNLGNTAAFGKAIREALALGLIDRAPRLAAVQASGAAPFAAAFDRGFDRLESVKAETIATAIKIGAPASYQRAVQSIRETDGVVTSVSDTELLAAKAEIDGAGIGCEPASAVSLAGVRKLRKSGVIAAGDKVAILLTGHILKDSAILQQMHVEGGEVPSWANPPRRIAAKLSEVARELDRS